MKLEDHVRKARVVAYFCERVTAGSAREMLPGLLMELSKSPRTTICPQSLSGVPVLSALTPCTLGDNSLPLPCVVPKRASAKDSPFIYSPFKRGSAAGKKLIWVADEVMSVRLMVCNRLPVNLSLDTIVLSVPRPNPSADCPTHSQYFPDRTQVWRRQYPPRNMPNHEPQNDSGARVAND